MTHCLLASEMPRSCWALGSAMFTMVESSTTISWAREMKTSAFQRRGSGWSAFSGMRVSTSVRNAVGLRRAAAERGNKGPGARLSCRRAGVGRWPGAPSRPRELSGLLLVREAVQEELEVAVDV